MMSIKRRLAVAASSLFAMLLGTLALAQSQSSNVTTQSSESSTTPTVWYDERWVWAIGVAVFLIIVIALTTRSRRV
jgi:hypothetical protein